MARGAMLVVISCGRRRCLRYLWSEVVGAEVASTDESAMIADEVFSLFAISLP